MTRAEAVKYLKAMKDGCNDTCYKVRYVTHNEALDMAIQALSREPTDDATLKDIFCMGCEYKEQEPKSPCDVCRYNPPSSTDGKPCTMCPAEGRAK